MGRMATCLVLFAVFFCIGFGGIASGDWANYANPVTASGFALDGDTVWIAAQGGLVDYNTSATEFTVYTSSDGLPCSIGNAVAVAADGTLWAAMDKGFASRHLVGTITRYLAENSTLDADGGKAIAVGADGIVWAGTDEGLYSYDGDSWQKYPYFGTPMLSWINVIAVDNDGNIWAGTEGGVRFFDGTDWTIYNELNSGLTPGQGLNVRDITFAPDGKVWMATYGGIISFDGVDVWEVFDGTNTPMMLPMISSIAVSLTGDVYAGHPAGILHFDGADWTVMNVDTTDLPDNNVSALGIAPDGTLWVGGPGGTASFIDATWTLRPHSHHPMLTGQISRIVEDNEGKVWFATLGGGVVCKEDDTWTNYTTDNSDLVNDMVSVIQVATDGSLWFGTEDGVSHFDGATFENYSLALENFPAGNVVDFGYGADGALWAVVQNFMTPSSLHYFSEGVWSAPDFVPMAQFTCIEILDDGKVWAGTQGQGIFAYNAPFWTPMDTNNCGIPGNNVLCMEKNASGSILVGTTTGFGVTNGNVWQQYYNRDSMLVSNEIRDIHASADGSIYLSTKDGLVAFSADTSVRYSSSFSGLLTDVGNSVLQTTSGVVYVGSQTGITEFSSPSFPSLADGTVDPQSGTVDTVFTYSIHYANPEVSIEPDMYVNIDGIRQRMTLADGQADDGTYEFATTLSSEFHGYDFFVTDVNGARTMLPFMLSTPGPSVSEYPIRVAIEMENSLITPSEELTVFLTLINNTQLPQEITLYTAVRTPQGTLLFFKYPSQFTDQFEGLNIVLQPEQRYEKVELLSIALDENEELYGNYVWMAACADPNAADLELLSDISEFPWEFRGPIVPPSK